MDLPTQTFERNNYSNLLNLPIANYSSVKPSLLIGLDNSHLCVAKEMVSCGPNEPIAIATKLGWVVYGPTNAGSGPTANVLHVRKQFSSQQLHRLVEEYFSLDSFAVKKPDTPLQSIEDLRAREILCKTTKTLGIATKSGYCGAKIKFNCHVVMKWLRRDY